jgi:hypothetical protein
MIGRKRWYKKVIRSTEINRKCYDCTIALKVSRSILCALKEPERQPDRFEKDKGFEEHKWDSDWINK